MKNVPIKAILKRTGELRSSRYESRIQVQALRNEVCALKKVNSGLGKRLDILRSWALRNIHLRNEMIQHTASTAPKT